MAKQKGIVKIEGTIGGMTFYKTQDGHVVREKGGVTAAKIANDPAFQRTRENGKEFGNAGISGKLIRDTVRSMMMTASDSRVTSRLTKLLMGILKMDLNSARGERNVGAGLSTPQGKVALKGFNFNIQAMMGSILYKPYVLDKVTGQINLVGLVPINDIVPPEGTTHVSLKCAFAKVDFASGTSAITFSVATVLSLDAQASDVFLMPEGVPQGDGVAMYFLQLEFFQVVNGQYYSLKNGAFNALDLVEVV